MSNFMASLWGKVADKLVTGCGQYGNSPDGVYKRAHFHTLFTLFVRAFTHSKISIFTAVNWRVLPIINTPNNKGDKYINKSLLLIGGCV